MHTELAGAVHGDGPFEQINNHTTNKELKPATASTMKVFSLNLWGALPAPVQRFSSRVYSSIYDTRFSARFIKPYCAVHYNDPDYLDNFKPPQGKTDYHCFQDFFTREFKEIPAIQSEATWPCEGLLCHVGQVKDIPNTCVKGDIRTVPEVFGLKEVNPEYHFTNVFLHNNNYHRIHAPVNGTISRIQWVKGDLTILRPWIYKQNPSIPAFRNERVNVDITDNQGRLWHLSIVGGPAVGTIKLPGAVKEGNTISAADELALFLLGSTCCMASPEAPSTNHNNVAVDVFQPY